MKKPLVSEVKDRISRFADNEGLLELILDNIDAHVYIKDAQGRYLYANPKVEELYFRALADIIGKTDYEFHSRQIADRLVDADRKVLASGEKIAVEERVNDAFGNLKSYWSVKLPLKQPGQPDCLLGLSIDVTELVNVKERNEFRSHILEMMARGSALNDVLRAIVTGLEGLHHGAQCSILLADAQGVRFEEVIAPSLPDFMNDAVRHLQIGVGIGSCGTAAATGQRVIASDVLTDPNWKQFRDLALRAGLRSCWSQPIISSKNKVLGTFAIYRSVPGMPSELDLSLIESCANLGSIAIEKNLAEEAIRGYAFCDSLTGLPNRRLLADRLAIARALSQRTGNHGAVLWLDLDHFKPLNDTHGHHAGDLLLVDLAARLTANIRETDTVARIGGDEFVIVLGGLGSDPEAARTEALKLAEKLRLIVAQPFEITLKPPGGADQRIEHQCFASIGVALFCDGKQSDVQILKCADEAMYQAKEAGRNRVKLYVAQAT